MCDFSCADFPCQERTHRFLTCAGLRGKLRAHSKSWFFGGPLGLPQRESADTSRRGTSRRGRHRALILPLFAVALVAVGLLFVFNTPAGDLDGAPALDADLCAIEKQHITGSATYLLDLRKPLGDATAPGRSLRGIGQDLEAGAELQVYAITDDAASPRRRLDRFCKPYSEAEIVVRAAKDQAKRDCDELPAQVSARLRDLATRFCARRDALQAQIDRLAAQTPRSVANAYLIEALQETAAALANRRKPWTLYVFSDMLQHADWYSHLDLRWTEWGFDNFAERAVARAASSPAAGASLAGARVTVFYPPRRRVTDGLRPRYAHQTFWRAYFKAQQAAVEFVELSRAPSYHAPRLMVTAMEELTQDIDAVLQDTEKRRKAAAEKELALADLETQLAEEASPAPAVSAPPASQAAETVAETASTGDTAPNPGGESTAIRQLEAEAVAPPSSTASTERAETAESSTVLADVVAEPPLTLPERPAPAADTRTLAQTPNDPPLPGCVISLKPEFEPSLTPGGYPNGRRVSYGAGTVTVRYSVDAQGRTVNAAVVAGADGATPGGAFADLAQDTVAQVRRWEFSLPEGHPGDCSLVPQIATFNYVERCRGSPVPTCRTVYASVAAVEGGSL